MISEMAYIHPDAKLGTNVTVEPFAYIAADVVVGDDCLIKTGAVLLAGTRMGKGCQVHTAAVIAGEPQDLKFKGEYSTVEIGDHNIIRECVTISRGTSAKGKTVVGSHNLIMAYAHIAHDCVVVSHCVSVNRVSRAGAVVVGGWGGGVEWCGGGGLWVYVGVGGGGGGGVVLGGRGVRGGGCGSGGREVVVEVRVRGGRNGGVCCGGLRCWVLR